MKLPANNCILIKIFPNITIKKMSMTLPMSYEAEVNVFKTPTIKKQISTNMVEKKIIFYYLNR